MGRSLRSGREHFYWGFLDDPIGVELRHHVGVDRSILATGVPHQESDWPDSEAVVDRIFEGVPEDDKHKMLVSNVVEFFPLGRPVTAIALTSAPIPSEPSLSQWERGLR